MARSLFPSLKAFLSTASDEKLREGLTAIRDVIDGLLQEKEG